MALFSMTNTRKNANRAYKRRQKRRVEIKKEKPRFSLIIAVENGGSKSIENILADSHLLFPSHYTLLSEIYSFSSPGETTKHSQHYLEKILLWEEILIQLYEKICTPRPDLIW